MNRRRWQRIFAVLYVAHDLSGSGGARVLFQVRAPAPTRAAAEALCARMLSAGGACVVLRS